jgi:hypothetical protein
MEIETMDSKERPIIFSADSVQSIYWRNKTQTRRVMKPQDWSVLPKCPYGRKGDLLWVREKWQVLDHDFGGRLVHEKIDHDDVIFEEVPSAWIIGYEEGGEKWANPEDRLAHWAEQFGTANTTGGCDTRWRSPIFMPKWASRLWLEITRVTVQHVQSISAEGCIKEGIIPYIENYQDEFSGFEEVWDSHNAKRGFPWDSNPWVWVISFKRAFRSTERMIGEHESKTSLSN